MFFWVGVSEGRLIWIPRKPTPLGFMLKTVVDTKTGVCLSAEIVEGASVDGAKEYVEDWGKTTACTLRLVRKWSGSGRIVIGDAWFGSYRTAVCLLKHGLYFVGNVKTAHKRFPKQLLKSKLAGRGSRVHMRVRIPGEEGYVFGSGHQDV